MDPDEVLRGAGLTEQHLVDLGLPLAEPGAGPGADVAALVAVGAAVGTVLLELDRHVVLVAQDMEGADHDARRAARAQVGEDDLVVEVPPLGLIGRRHHLYTKYRDGLRTSPKGGPGDQRAG